MNLPQEQMTMTRCPFCAEEILSAAKKCKHCGEIVDPAMRLNDAGNHAKETREPNLIAPTKKPFRNGVHVFISIITAGFWVPIWALLYFARDRNVYY
jgi:uncharacterized membrane protein YvbJ